MTLKFPTWDFTSFKNVHTEQYRVCKKKPKPEQFQGKCTQCCLQKAEKPLASLEFTLKCFSSLPACKNNIYGWTQIKPNQVFALWEDLNHCSQLPRVLQHHHGGWGVFLRGDSADIKVEGSGNIQKRTFKGLSPLPPTSLNGKKMRHCFPWPSWASKSWIYIFKIKQPFSDDTAFAFLGCVMPSSLLSCSGSAQYVAGNTHLSLCFPGLLLF